MAQVLPSSTGKSSPNESQPTTGRLLPPSFRDLPTVLAAAGLCAVLLVLTIRLYQADLTVPLNYLGDAVVFLAKAKGILQGDWIHYNSRLGMPFGADLRDFPLNITF